MAKWLVLEVGDDIPSARVKELLNAISEYQSSTWHESKPHVFKTSEESDETKNAWLKEKGHTRDRY